MAATFKAFFFDRLSNRGRDLVGRDVTGSLINVTVVKGVGINADLRSSLVGDDADPYEFVGGVVHFEDVQRLLVLWTDGYAQAIEARDLVGVSSPQVFTQGLVGKTSG